MQFTAQQIATLINAAIQGPADASVHNFAKIEEGKPGDLCFLANPKYEEYLYNTNATIVIISNKLQLKQAITPTLLLVDDPYAAFAILLNVYQDAMAKASVKTGIEQPSYIAPDAVIGNNVYIAAFAYIGSGAHLADNVQIMPHTHIGAQVHIGKGTTIHSGVQIYHHTIIGSNCIIHSGAVIGSDGFGFAQQAGVYNKIPQIGNVVIGNAVEIGANCTIDRATMGSTLIQDGVKLDNLVQIAHNVVLGANTVMAAQAGVAGSTKLGKGVVVGGQAGITGHITIADGVMINAQSGVSKTILSNDAKLTGTPAFDFKNAMKSQAVYKNLPTLQLQVNKLQQLLDQLQQK
jgi:UDP-3-O-[3-hydroxymyristoyl] glucosamine N-acyltransferase